MKDLKANGPGSLEMTKAQAVEILAQCKALRWSVHALEAKAKARLKRPELKVVKSDK